MARSHSTAKQAGTWMESAVVAHLRRGLKRTPLYDFIERRAKTGSKDQGDIAGIRTINGLKVVVEVKNTARVLVGPWLNETEVERVNNGAAAGVVIYKRTGFGEKNMGQQVVMCTLDDFLVLIGGERDASD